MNTPARPELEEAQRRLSWYRKDPTEESRHTALQAYNLLSISIQEDEIDLALEVSEIIEELEHDA